MGVVYHKNSSLLPTFLDTIAAAAAAAAAAKLLQSCRTLCNPIDSSPPGYPVPGILQARTLEWVAISFSNAWKSKVKVKSLSCVWPSGTPWTAAFQAPPSMGFSRQSAGVGCQCFLWVVSGSYSKHLFTKSSYFQFFHSGCYVSL